MRRRTTQRGDAHPVHGLHGMTQHHRLNSAPLVVLLQQWTREASERAAHPVSAPKPPDVAEQLSQWLGTVDAVQLSRALHAIESLPSQAAAAQRPALALNVAALTGLVQQTRADLEALMTTKPAAPKPLRARADNTPVELPDPMLDTDFATHAPRYLDLQKQMDLRLQTLRAQVRQAIAQGTATLRQIAALDAVMERMLASREQRLWALLPAHLERRLAHRQRQHQHRLMAQALADEPARWRQAGGWLWAFERDMQALLMAELQARVEPITGLLEAAQNDTTGQQE